MDFDEEMSSLQIEDLGEYFFPNDLPNDNWKGFSLGYGDDESTSSTTTTSKPVPIARSASTQRDRSHSLGGGGISLGTLTHDPSLVVSPPLMAPTFAEMLKHTNDSLTAAALGLSGTDFLMSPATTHLSTTTTQTTSASPARTKDEQLMDLTNFTLEGRFNRVVKPQPILPPRGNEKPVLCQDGSNASSVCKSIMDEEEDEEDDEDDDSDKRRSSRSSTPSTTFGKRSFDMVDSCSSSTCATIVAPEDDRGFRKKSREKMRRQEVNVKFDELIELLGLSNRVRKSAILQEAVSAIKTLKRERDEMRRDRDRLQQEVSKLATCLQYSHLGSVAAANAVAMSQVTQNNPQFASLTAQPSLTQLNAHQLPGPGCFPIGGPSFGAALAPAGSVVPTPTSSVLAATPIAPKIIKAASDGKS